MNNGEWFIYVVSATLLYGTLNFLYKIAAKQGYSSSDILNKAAITVSCASLFAIFATERDFSDPGLLVLLALINSSFFAMGSMSKIVCLRATPASYAFPLMKMNAFVAIMLSVIFLGERPVWNQWLGIGVALFMVAMISLDAGKKPALQGTGDGKGLLFAALAAMMTGVSIFTGKIASGRVHKLSYIFISYTLVAIYTFFINRRFHGRDASYSVRRDNRVYLYGFLIGLMNFAGYWLILKAFSLGPLSLVQGISATSIVIPVLLSTVILGEEFSWKRGLIVFLAITAVLLIKSGS